MESLLLPSFNPYLQVAHIGVSSVSSMFNRTCTAGSNTASLVWRSLKDTASFGYKISRRTVIVAINPNLWSILFGIEDVNQVDDAGWTPLHNAVENGNLRAIELLLAALGINVNQVNDAGFTPLHKAVQMGNLDAIELLLAAPGIDVNQVSNNGWTPLRWAVNLNNRDAISLLCRYGANVTDEILRLVVLRFGNDFAKNFAG